MGESTFKGVAVTDASREFSKDFGSDLGKFTVRIPLPYDKANIISAVSRAIGGVNLNSMRAEDYEYIRMIVTLNSVIVNHPDWWKGADQCPDDDFVMDVWKHFIDSERKFSESLKKNVGIKAMG